MKQQCKNPKAALRKSKINPKPNSFKGRCWIEIPLKCFFANTFLILLQLACQAPQVQQQQQQRDGFQHPGLNAANKKQSLT